MNAPFPGAPYRHRPSMLPEERVRAAEAKAKEDAEMAKLMAIPLLSIAKMLDRRSETVTRRFNAFEESPRLSPAMRDAMDACEAAAREFEAASAAIERAVDALAEAEAVEPYDPDAEMEAARDRREVW